MHRIFKISLILILLVTSFKGFLWLKGYRSPQLFGKLISHVETSDKIVALTYDDGPNSPNTNEILKISELLRHQ